LIDGSPDVPHTGAARRDSYAATAQGGGGIIKQTKPKKKGIDWSAQITQVKVFTEVEPEAVPGENGADMKVSDYPPTPEIISITSTQKN
jgi:hypothetical protein